MLFLIMLVSYGLWSFTVGVEEVPCVDSFCISLKQLFFHLNCISLLFPYSHLAIMFMKILMVKCDNHC